MSPDLFFNLFGEQVMYIIPYASAAVRKAMGNFEVIGIKREQGQEQEQVSGDPAECDVWWSLIHGNWLIRLGMQQYRYCLINCTCEKNKKNSDANILYHMILCVTINDQS